jgi:hypothetical protein
LPQINADSELQSLCDRMSKVKRSIYFLLLPFSLQLSTVFITALICVDLRLNKLIFRVILAIRGFNFVICPF